MRHMQLDFVKADAQAPLRRRDKSGTHTLHVRLSDFARHVPTIPEWDW